LRRTAPDLPRAPQDFGTAIVDVMAGFMFDALGAPTTLVFIAVRGAAPAGSHRARAPLGLVAKNSQLPRLRRSVCERRACAAAHAAQRRGMTRHGVTTCVSRC
jgi:hypothetical protein